MILHSRCTSTINYPPTNKQFYPGMSAVPEMIDEAMAKTLAGDLFDATRWGELNVDGFVTKATFVSLTEDAAVAAAETNSPKKQDEVVEASPTEVTPTEPVAAVAAVPSGPSAQEVGEQKFKDAIAAQNAAGIDWKAVHSCVRWDKPPEECENIIVSAHHANSVDEKNGNYPLHIAAQNGHINLVTWLVQHGAEVNVQNGTGTSPLHMSISYDYAECAIFLKANGADGDLENWAGCPSKHGIEGERNPDNPMVLLEICTTTEDALKALTMLDVACKEETETLDKGAIATMGMQVKKGNKALAQENWTPECQKLFTCVMQQL